MASDSKNQTGQRYQRIGKYQILKHIANGGMGAVYKALDTELQRQVALKILHPDLASKPNMLERFRREARAAANLRHENIVTLYEQGQDKDTNTYYLAMEFIEGVDLYEHITRKGKLKAEEARQILIQAARALDHAYKQGIVHRDIKPNNFLLTESNGELVVKLTDMGLARPVQDEQYRVTAPSTTVGTVDYMSPEQARDSRAADIRSDIYSLGCTFFHMLGGIAPFAEGSLTDRLFKHADKEAPDIRSLNKSVPDGLVVILQKMLAKKPTERYQTPAELLDDLDGYKKLRLATGRAESLASLAALAHEDSRPPTAPSKSKNKLRRRDNMEAEVELRAPIPPAEDVDTKAEEPVRRDSQDKPKSRPAVKVPPRPKKFRDGTLIDETPPKTSYMGVLMAVGMVLLAGLLIYIGMKLTARDPAPPKKDPTFDPLLLKKDPDPIPQPKEKDPKPEIEPKPPQVEKKGKYPSLFRPAKAAEPAELAKEFFGPFGTIPSPNPGAVLFRVSRTAAAGVGSFASLAEAIASALPGQTVIEIFDRGPLFVPSLPPIQDRNIVIRGGDGYRPLIAWEIKPTSKDAAGGDTVERMMSLVSSQLQLVDVDIVARCQEMPGSVCFFHLQGGELQAQRCSFSLAGKQGGGVALARLEPYAARMPRCRLSHCYARGADLVAIDVQRGGEALLDGTVIAGGQAPLIRAGEAPATVRVVRSTLAAGNNLLAVQTSPATSPAVKFFSWDSIFAASGPFQSGTLIRLGANPQPERLSWRVYNCLYAGWKNLLEGGGQSISAAALKTFQDRWKYAEGDRVLDATWPPRTAVDIDEIAAKAFETRGTPLSFAATTGDVPLGCEPAHVPAGPTSWLKRTFSPPDLDAIPLPGPFAVPAFPSPTAGEYHGERLDLSKIDLGKHLEARLKSARPAARVILHLTGQGERTTSPIRVKGITQLAIYFEPAKAKPLTLTPHPQAAGNVEALIDVEDGSLEVINGRFRLENSRFAPGPKRLIRVKDGSLRLGHCSLIGPMRKGPKDYVGLIDYQPGESTSAVLAMHESVLISDKKLIMIQGAKAPMRVKQCLLVCGEDGILVKASAANSAAQHHWLWEHNTFAFAGDLIDAGELSPGLALLPALLIQSQGNLFLAPFQDQPRKASLLRCRGDWLVQGSMLWHGKYDGFDQKRFASFVTLADRESTLASFAQWTNLWGTVGEQQPLLFDRPLTGPDLLSLDQPPSLNRLGLPAGVQPLPGQPPPGADLAKLPN